MKKFLTIAMVALLAVTTAFAGAFNGTFEGAYTANLAAKTAGYATTPGFTLTFDATTGETAHDADVYANLAGTFKVGDLDADGNLAVGFELTDASINGANWNVNLAGAQGLNSYANGFAKRVNAAGTKAAAPALAVAVENKAAGITATFMDYTVAGALQFNGAADAVYEEAGEVIINPANRAVIKNADGEAYSEEDAPDWTVVMSYKLGDPTAASKSLYGAFFLPTYKFVEDKLTVTGDFGALATKKNDINLGFGAKVAYADDALSAAVGFDGVLNITDDVKFNADAALTVAYAPVSVDVYYATNAKFYKGTSKVAPAAENLLDVKVATDLKSFEIPVSFAITGTDLVNDNRGLDASVTAAFAGVNLGVNGGYNFGKKAWNAGVSADYTLENVAKFAAEFGLDGKTEVETVSFGVSAENTTLIQNATLKLAYASENFLDEAKAAGALTASVGIEF